MSSQQSAKGQSLKDALSSIFASGVIVIAVIISIIIYLNVMGNPVNFEENIVTNHPKPGNYLGIIYKGGPIVPVLMSLVIILITFVVERFITITRAKGKGRLARFVRSIQTMLSEDRIEDAIASCDQQRGSLASVMKSGLIRYRDLQADPELGKDQKVIAIQKEIEEATALELPMLSKNLVFMSTIASIAVLVGLIGTVLGMIKAFSALAQAGAPDASALANGISEALINTAFGITGSTLAIIFYNYFSTAIDGFTYKIDEAGFSLVQTFASSLKKS